MAANRNKRQRTKTHSDIMTSHFLQPNRGLPLPECRNAMRNPERGQIPRVNSPREMTLNIWRGNGAAIVVRGL